LGRSAFLVMFDNLKRTLTYSMAATELETKCSKGPNLPAPSAVIEVSEKTTMLTPLMFPPPPYLGGSAAPLLCIRGSGLAPTSRERVSALKRNETCMVIVRKKLEKEVLKTKRMS
jgi:hypothetical protein